MVVSAGPALDDPRQSVWTTIEGASGRLSWPGAALIRDQGKSLEPRSGPDGVMVNKWEVGRAKGQTVKGRPDLQIFGASVSSFCNAHCSVWRLDRGIVHLPTVEVAEAGEGTGRTCHRS